MVDNEFTDKAIREQYEAKRKEIKDGIESIEDELELRKDMLSIRQRMLDAKEGQRELINPTWAFENDDDYVEALVEFNELRDEMMIRDDERKIAETRDNLEDAKQKLKQVNDRLEELDEEGE